jgi:hypothetical protein
MHLIAQLLDDVRGAIAWQGRVLRERVMRVAWSVGLTFLAVALVFVSVLAVLGAAYLQVAAVAGARTGLLTVAALAVLCALGAGLAARSFSER